MTGPADKMLTKMDGKRARGDPSGWSLREDLKPGRADAWTRLEMSTQEADTHEQKRRREREICGWSVYWWSSEAWASMILPSARV